MTTEYNYLTRYWARVTGFWYGENCDAPAAKKAKTGINFDRVSELEKC